MSSPMPVSSIPECIKAIQPDSNGWVPPGTCGYYGKMYYPSFIAAAVFSIIAGAMLLGHLIQAIRYSNSRLQRFAVSVSTCLFTGYVARAVGTRHQQNIYIAAFSDTMVLVSPILITVFDYMLFVNMVQFYKAERLISGVTSHTICWALIISLSLLTLVQLITCGMIVTGNSPGTQRSGINVYIGTISIQEVLVLYLIALVVKFHTSMNRTNRSQLPNHEWAQWQVISLTLYISLGAICLRIAYRLIELSQVFQVNKILPHREIFFYGFEAVPILIALSVWTVVTTGRLGRPNFKETDYDYQEMREFATEEIMPSTTSQA